LATLTSENGAIAIAKKAPRGADINAVANARFGLWNPDQPSRFVCSTQKPPKSIAFLGGMIAWIYRTLGFKI
jgi:hypothetical protein